MNYTENAINIVTAKTYKGIGRAWVVKNLKGNEKVETIVSLLNKTLKEADLITINDFKIDRENIKKSLMGLENFADGLVAIGDDNFPAYRGNVKSSEQPIFLFYRGDLNLLHSKNKNVAVIGLLQPDNDTEIIERQVVDILVKKGVTIVSGLALGCDTIAHRQALDSKGKTVAILPSSLKDISPATNRKLADEIVQKNGLLITEYYEDAKSKRELGGRYQERDRLQALFSDSIILSASYAINDQGNDSGSRLAMNYALNYSIPRAVIYDNIINLNNPKYDLSRQLIEVERSILIINQKNLLETADRIMSLKPKIENRQLIQNDLF